MNNEPATINSWLVDPLSSGVRRSVAALLASDDVRRVALMPDVHLAADVCVGAVVATERLLYPAAIGGDIGCGMLSLAFNAEANAIDNERSAAGVLAGLYELVPSNKHRQPRDIPALLTGSPLSDARLQKLLSRDGRVQFGTLGRGNHFVEFQADEEERLWVTIHSGSRAVGQAITKHHLGCSKPTRSGLQYLEAGEDTGRAYLADLAWARTYAAENRLAMSAAIIQMMRSLYGIQADELSLIHCDHNHLQQELHDGETLWIHRKGAQSAKPDELGIIPGSMGTVSYHTLGRGCASALMSCSHGAGRELSRSAARQRVSEREFTRQVGSVWYDHRIADRLRDEAPAAYKDIRRVMKAQRELTRIVRTLRPVLSYKGV